MQPEPIILSAKQVAKLTNERIKPNLACSAFLKKQVEERVNIWQYDVATNLEKLNPFKSEELAAKEFTDHVNNGNIDATRFSKATELFIASAVKLGSSVSQSYWKDQSNTFKARQNSDTENLVISSKLLAREWHKLVDQAKLQWLFEQLEMKRAKFIEEMFELIKNVEVVTQKIKTIGFDPNIYFAPLSTGKLKPIDIALIQRWSSYLESDNGVKRLCELLGRTRQAEANGRIESVKVTHTVSTPAPTSNSKEEIVGIKLGNDIENTIPSELALLSDPDTSLLFELKLIESRLMCFDMQGVDFVSEEQEVIEEQHTKDNSRKGPFLVCIDTSGSMQGKPEVIAKAITLFIANAAKEQERNCYLINFSTEAEYFDAGDLSGLESLVEFLKMSFGGGTDAEPALSHALEVMSQDTYKDADLLVISDFIMGDIPKRIVSKIEKLRENGNKFYSLAIMSTRKSEQLETLFDDEWVFDPYTNSVRELVNFKQDLNSRTRSQANG